MLETFLFEALPYVAIVVCLVGSIYRIRKEPMTYSALSSQFLENKGIKWGSLPWHIGITIILLGHIVIFLAPEASHRILSDPNILMIVEAGGFGLSLLCLIGLGVLGIRRVTSSRIQSVTTTMDLVVIAILFLQVLGGTIMAAQFKWGALWSTGTTCQYLWSLACLQPDMSYISELPVAVKFHIIGAWVLVLLVPFSRLLHMFSVPLAYLTRPPQNVIWTNPRRLEGKTDSFIEARARRHFILAGGGIGFGVLLLSVGTVRKVIDFFFGPRLSEHEEAQLMEEKLERLELTTKQRKLELERQKNNYILVAPLSELSREKGKYFIDFDMQPGIAFKDTDGMPLLISAKCTHLGCTVGNDVKDGKILCPCHVSYFDIQTGAPNAGSPATKPLPHIGWVVMDTRGKVFASRDASGKIEGGIPAEQKDTARVYIAKLEESKR